MKLLGLFEYCGAKITLESSDDEMVIQITVKDFDGSVEIYESNSLGEAKDWFQHGVENAMHQISRSSLSSFMQVGHT